MGFLRLLTNKYVMQDEVMNPGQAWHSYQILRADRRMAYLAEPAGLSEVWSFFTRGLSISPNLWTDAYLCAFVHATGLTLATFDAGIPVRREVGCLVLSP